MAAVDNTLTVSGEVESFLGKLALLEFKEVLSLVEMVLWRMKLDDMTEGDAAAAAENRNGCRVQSGIGIVVENVLPFLGNNIILE